jgi:hypothetical protein
MHRFACLRLKPSLLLHAMTTSARVSGDQPLVCAYLLVLLEAAAVAPQQVGRAAIHHTSIS